MVQLTIGERSGRDRCKKGGKYEAVDSESWDWTFEIINSVPTKRTQENGKLISQNREKEARKGTKRLLM